MYTIQTTTVTFSPWFGGHLEVLKTLQPPTPDVVTLVKSVIKKIEEIHAKNVKDQEKVYNTLVDNSNGLSCLYETFLTKAMNGKPQETINQVYVIVDRMHGESVKFGQAMRTIESAYSAALFNVQNKKMSDIEKNIQSLIEFAKTPQGTTNVAKRKFLVKSLITDPLHAAITVDNKPLDKLTADAKIEFQKFNPQQKTGKTEILQLLKTEEQKSS